MFKSLVELAVAASKPEPQGATCFRPLEAGATPKKSGAGDGAPQKNAAPVPAVVTFFKVK